ncbi:hypothetical protein IHE44_0001147 [Lamprotornis superbus]|uniref:Pleckstrin homology domain-containing family F member 2 n=1 Tax=Lamprotornis superbus TaxID=245042 RepID=A0A835TZI6_9PASS|nr:hypothetical protein IHE44_0001147 [Lamprotornis superbus]
MDVWPGAAEVGYHQSLKAVHRMGGAHPAPVQAWKGGMVDRLANSEANTRRISIVENCFGAAGQPLTIPGRVLIGEGVLTKLCRKKPKARQFFLFNDILVYGNIVIQKKKYNKQHIIPLENVTIDSIQDEGDLRNGWLIKTPTKSFAVYAATATEKSEWMNHINKCVSDLLSKSGKTPSNEHAAVWVPDSEATVCMRCQKAKFTPVNRRHHCRKCGFVVCGPCSEKRFLLPSQSSKPVRICDFCYDLLSTGEMTACQSTSILSSPLCLDKEFDAKFNLPVSGSSFPLPVTAVYIRAVRTRNSVHTQTADYPKAPSWKMHAHYHIYCNILKLRYTQETKTV